MNGLPSSGPAWEALATGLPSSLQRWLPPFLPATTASHLHSCCASNCGLSGKMCAALLFMKFFWANKPSASSSGEPCHDKWPATSHPSQCETFCCHTAWPSMILRGHPTTTTSPPSSSPTAFSSPFPKFYSVHQRRRPGREVESSSTPTGLSCPHTLTPEW